MTTYITNIGLLATPRGDSARRGRQQGEITLLRDAWVAVEGGKIAAVGQGQPAPEDGDTLLDAGGRLMTPGLVDAHTHLIFGGWRQNELGQKLRGVPYLDILAQGGGILSTVRATRAASEEQLAHKAEAVLTEMLRMGVTTCEAKSGYGLEPEQEYKQLRVIRRLNETQPVELAATFMGAHALPEEYRGRREDYIRLLCREMIPYAAREGLAEFCDVFCEEGVFTARESRTILEAGLAHGLRPKVHADEIAAVACCLPATSFYLGAAYAPAREMIGAGVPVAVATDFNPGSCPGSSLQLAMNIACLKYRMTPEEVLTAVTLNAAAAIGRAGTIGSVEPGKQADLLLWNAPDLDYVCYRFGSNLVGTVMKKGRIVHEE